MAHLLKIGHYLKHDIPHTIRMENVLGLESLLHTQTNRCLSLDMCTKKISILVVNSRTIQNAW